MSTNRIVDITSQLQDHVSGTANADDPGNLADLVWMLNHNKGTTDTEGVWDRLQQAFEELNCVLDTVTEPHLFRLLSYAVNGLLVLCLTQIASASCNETTRTQMLRLCWRIGTAWDAVLAGDIESIRQHISIEEDARTIR
jgi:hypothetical protein